MRLFQRIFIWLFVIMAFVVLGFYVFVKVSGKQFVEQRLSEIFRREVQTADVRFIFPLGLRLDRLDIQGFFRAKEIRLQMRFPIVLGKQIFIAGMRIEEPFMVMQRTKTSQLIIQESAVGISPSSSAAPAAEDVQRMAAQGSPEPSGETLSLVIDDIQIHNGQLQFIDYSKEKPLDLTLERIQLKAQPLAYPMRSLNTKFNFSAFMASEDIPFSGSHVRSQGWINWWERNLDGVVEILEPNGMVGLSADLKAQHNDLLVKGKINMNYLGKKANNADKQDSFSVEDFIVKALKESSLEINANFAVRTQLDNFELSSISFSGSIGSPENGALKENLKSIGQKFEEFGKKLIEKESPQNVNAIAPQGSEVE